MATERFDPLKYERSTGAQMFGGFSYRLRYDVEFGRKWYSMVTMVIGLIILIIGLVMDSASPPPENQIAGQVKKRGSIRTGWASQLNRNVVIGIGGGVMGFSIVVYFIYPMIFRYDVGSTVAYCRRRLPANATDEQVRKCVERREN